MKHASWRRNGTTLMVAILVVAGVVTPTAASAAASRPATTSKAARHSSSEPRPPVGVAGQDKPPAAATDQPTGATPPAGVHVTVLARSATPTTVPGGEAGFFVVVSDEGTEATPAGQPVTLDLTLPAATSFVSVEDMDTFPGLVGSGTSQAQAPAGTTWVCAPGPAIAGTSAGSATVRCVYGVRAGGAVTPVPLAARSAVPALVVLRVDKHLVPASNGTVLSLHAAVDVPGTAGGPAQRTSAGITAVAGSPSPALFPNVSGSSSVQVGQQGTEAVAVLNVGSGPATTEGSATAQGSARHARQPSVRLSDLLPGQLVGSWQGTGDGWTCRGGGTENPACTYNRAVAVGHLTSMLTVTYRLDPKAVGRLGLVPGDKPKAQRWSIALAAHGPTPSPHTTTSAYHATVSVAPQPGSSLMLEASAAGGIDQLLPGSGTTVGVTVANNGASPTTGAVRVRGSLPAGVRLIGASGLPAGVAAAGTATTGAGLPWSCWPAGGTKGRDFLCSPTGESAVPAGGSSVLVLHLAAEKTVKPGAGAVVLQATAQNQIAGRSPARTTVPIFVLPGNVGFPGLVLSTSTAHAKAGTSRTTHTGTVQLHTATSGGPATLTAGRPFTERLDVRNLGGAPIEAATDAQLRQTFGSGVEVRSVHAAKGWRCTTGKGRGGTKGVAATKNRGGTKGVAATKAPRLECTVDVAQQVAPGASLTGPTVTVVPTRATSGTADWRATIRLTGRGRPPVNAQPVLVTVKAARAQLATDLVPRLLPTAGGIGRWQVRVHNRGTGPTAGPVRLTVRLPAGVTVRTIGADRWRCTAPGSSGGSTRQSGSPGTTTATCTSRGTAPAGHSLVPVGLTVAVGSTLGTKPITIQAASTDSGAERSTGTQGQRAAQGASASMTITPRPALHADISAPDTVVFVDQPITERGQSLHPTTVTLDGEGSGGSGRGLRYRWVQRCTSAKDAARTARCTVVAPQVHWDGQPAGTVEPITPTATFTTPKVRRPTPLIFQLTVSDGSATATSSVKVTAVPETTASQGFDLDRPHPPAPPRTKPTTHDPLPKPAEPLTARATSERAKSTSGAKTTSEHAGSPATTETAALLADTDTTPTTDAPTTTTPTEPTTTEVPTTVPPTTEPTTPPTSAPPTTTTAPSTTTTQPPTPPTPLSELFCSLVRDAAGSQGSFSTALPGGVTVHLANVTVTGSGCEPTTTVRFSGAIDLGTVLKATDVTGTVTKDGIALTGGRIEGPSAWHSPAFTITTANDSKGIFIAYPGTAGSSSTDVEIRGSVSASGLAFLPLPSGWEGTTTLTFATGATTAPGTVSLTSDATGPATDTSPDSPRPTISLAGTVAADGTFSLSASLQRLVQLQGHSIDARGTVTRTTPDGPISTSITGSLGEPFDITSGLRVDSLSVTVTPADGSLGLSGVGQVSLGAGSSSLGIGVHLTYHDPGDWALTADGTGSSSWEPIAGLTITPSDVHGAITAKNDAYTFSLDVVPHTPWNPVVGTTVSNLRLGLSNTCTATTTAAPCPTGASLYLQASGDVTLTLPVVGSLTTSLAGVVALPTGAISLTAALPANLSIGAGISLTKTWAVLWRGLPTPTGTATLATENDDPAGLSFAVLGSITIPTLGTLPDFRASWSSQGWSLAGALGSYSLPGGSGSGSTLRDTIIGWSSFSTSLTITDPFTNAHSTISLLAGAFTISGSYSTPDWFKDLFQLPTDLSGRATGLFDPASDSYSLRMSLLTPSDWYLFGDQASATSIRLHSAYFDIGRQHGDFSISLGGVAGLSIPAGIGLPFSSVDLAVALGYSATTRTISGNFSLPNVGSLGGDSSSTGWQDAFGVPGLTLYDLAIGFQINLATLVPGVGFGARAVLPPDLRTPLGMPDNTQTTLVANISTVNPCLGITVSNPLDPNQNVLDIDNRGALTAKEVNLEIAPRGCTVGSFHYDPGLTLGFNGAVLGVEAQVHAHLSVLPFAFDAKIDIGELPIGGLVVDHTSVAVSASLSGVSFSFAGGVHVLGTGVQVSGAFSQSGPTTTVDLAGNLSNLSLGEVVTIQSVTVAVHAVIGPQPVLNVAAAGSIDLLGSTATASFSLGIVNGELQQATADVHAIVTIGGPSGVVLDGSFKLDYGPGRPLAVDADVAVKAGGFELAHATAAIRPTEFTLTAAFSVAGVFGAQVTGIFFWGNVPGGATIAGPNGTTVAAQAGDFLLSAHDVSIDLGGFRSNATVTIGRTSGGPWADLATRIQLLGTGADNSVAITGAISSNGDLSFSGQGNLNLVGINGSVRVSVTKVGSAVAVSGAETMSVLGYAVSLAGDFAYNGGVPRFRLAGNAMLSLGGFDTSAAFVVSNFPNDAGLAASISLSAGSVLTLSGRLTVIGGDRFYLATTANLDLRVLQVPGTVVLTNCTDPSCTTGTGHTTLDAQAQVNVFGFSFGVSMVIGPGGTFTATARCPGNGSFYGSTGVLDLWIVQFRADLYYQMHLTISNQAPYVSVAGNGSGSVWGRSWGYQGFLWFGWGGWSQLLGVSASIQTNPFHACGSATIWGYSFGVCI